MTKEVYTLVKGDYSDAYILFKGNKSVNNTRTAAVPSNRNIKVTFKNCAPFTI